MITQVCNLSCHGCTNFSDLTHAGYVPWSQGKQWLEQWLEKIDISDFGIMGGEPLIHPEWKSWVIGIRNLLPNAQIRFTTNGSLLHRHPDILDFFQSIGNTVFKITVHYQKPELENIITEIQNSRKWEPVTEFGIQRWKTNNNLKLQINRPQWFYKTFQGTYNNMLPHISDPIQAFDNCIQKTCPLLYKGNIYKCSTSALTLEIIKKHSRTSLEKWIDYHDPGISADCDSEQLQIFLNNFGKPNRICSQCPTKNNLDSRLDHHQTVTFK